MEKEEQFAEVKGNGVLNYDNNETKASGKRFTDKQVQSSLLQNES